MKLTTLLLIVLTFQLYAAGTYAQKTRLSLDMGEATVEQVLQAVEEQSDFFFLFNQKLVDTGRKVRVDMEGKKIDDVLAQVFAGTNIEYVVLNKQIVLAPGEMLTDAKASLQPMTVSGTVTDENGETLPGVSIMLKGTTRGTVTNLNGEYTIQVDDPAATLIFSYVGYTYQEVQVGDQTNLDITLEQDLLKLDEVVVIGYGTMTKRDLTGSVSSVTPDEIVAVPVLSVDQAMSGRAAGVYVQQTESNPGGATQIRIRGVNSIEGNNDPLYIIDGLVGGNINSVDPSDIASIDVLKDASSTAIYGSRGANGVIMITTKGGKVGTSNISFDMYYGWQKLANKLDLMNAREHAEWVNAVNEAEGEAITFPDLNALEHDTDWQDEVYRVAPMQKYNLSASGGNERLNYFISGNYIAQDGIMKYTNYNRWNLRVNLDSKINDKLTVGTRIGFSRVKRTLQFGEDWGGGSDTHSPAPNVVELSPTTSPYDDEGNLVAEIQNTSGSFETNPLHHLANTEGHRYNTLLNGMLFADYMILPELSIRTNLGLNFDNRKDNRYKPSFVYEPNDGYRSRANVSTGIYTSWLSETFLTYEKGFGIHDLTVMGGFSAQEAYYEGMSAQAWDFAVDDFLYHNLTAGDGETNSIGTSMSRTAQASFIGRVHYVLNGKYLITVNGRYDGSSRFGKNNKWGFFPSGAVAWRLSDEDFIENLGIFSNLKLRASYGISGSDALGAYQSFSAMSPRSGAYVVNGLEVNGFRPTRLPNPNLRWEQTAQTDIGLDVGFFRGRLGLVLDYFNKLTEDLFLDKPVPRTAGVGSVRENIGSLQNYGFEFGVNAVPVQGDFSWNIGFNITHHQSEVKALVGDNDEIITGSVGGGLKIGSMQIIQVGSPFGSFYGYHLDGIWKSNDADLGTALQFGDPVQAGDWKLRDVNGDGNVNDDDREIIGNSQPKFYGGLNNTFTWKGFDASIFFQYAAGVNTLNAMQRRYLSVSSENNQLRDLIGNTWTPGNEDADYARIGYSEPGIITSRNVEDGSFIRLRELTIGYTLPRSVLNSINAERLRIYATGSNLLLFTNYMGYDPEVNIYGGDNTSYLNADVGSYPKARTFILGLNLTF